MTTPPPDLPTRTRWTKVLLVAVFLVLLWLPTFDAIFHFDQTTAFNEKRLPAAWPVRAPGWNGLQRYLGGLEAYFNDHFGFRSKLIHWHGEWQLALFNVGRKDIMTGKNGLLVLQ